MPTIGRSRWIALGCAVALAVPATLLGCGGGGDDGPPPPPKAGPLPTNPLATGGGGPKGYQPSAVGNGGSVTGKVEWTGPAYQPAPLPVTKDQTVCQHPEAVDQSLSVDNATKGVANVVVFLVGVDHGKPWGAAGHLDNKGCLFHPQVTLHGVGSGALNITNSDPINHNTHLYPTKNEDFNKMLGEAASLTYGEAGLKSEKRPMRVKCDLHGWMEAWVWTIDHPYYELSGKDGAFTIGDIPAGTYQLAAWHGKKDAIVQGPSVTVADGQAVRVALAMASDGTLSWK